MSSIPFNSNSTLGDGKGKEYLKFGHTESGNERSVYRKQLKKSFGNMYNAGLESSPILYNKNTLGPFRTAYNAGDVKTNSVSEQVNKVYGILPNQVGGNNLSRVNPNGGGLAINSTGNAMYSGNIKYVHDGSDYIRFKKLQAINKTYNSVPSNDTIKHGVIRYGRVR
tara:strand:- start:271 stop:771 length:501 start_codon:yes stop_codon:yes gene_type:complete